MSQIGNHIRHFGLPANKIENSGLRTMGCGFFRLPSFSDRLSLRWPVCLFFRPEAEALRSSVPASRGDRNDASGFADLAVLHPAVRPED
ncbi:hypothetical protein HOY34_20280 [Xinfangfangia sp. D13-10-4-6]|uniref:hypothetical protein n=1 Tax=Pseudogemmobacter hezensis TaxID=2737662 RepID=UPI0015562157|nr:hypothetical protein [Pseudogemmobacter hezensis]NPD17525.1 hypothetical protein [Pseudogemmobacter hezensis]